MITKLQKWGNSQGFRIPKQLLYEASFSEDQDVEIVAMDGKIIIKPLSKIRHKYSLEKLLENIHSDDSVQEEDWGKPLGKEVW
ncbi:MAG: AbrB/MazE/SpoVT family DNA-binding domain-containing protein [Firmicutes bacterium]|nr:AbrB/MazE/SpoVT family DNA-binding domain-containing protein [Bacillota bacterium]